MTDKRVNADDGVDGLEEISHAGEVEVPAVVLEELARAFGVPDAADGTTEDPGAVSATPDAVIEPDIDIDPDIDPDTDREIDPEMDPTAPVTRLISIDDDELPDVVYLDEVDLPGSVGAAGGSPQADAAARSSTAPVLIIDHDTPDAMVPDATLGDRARGDGSGGIEPRFRARRISVRRAEGRRRLRGAVLVLGIVGLLVALLALAGSPLFSVDARDVTVTGAVYTDRERLQGIIAEVVGSTTLLVDTADIERQIEEIPWVAIAQVRTSFPTGVRIEIRERVPLASYQGSDGRFRVIDRDGRVLDVIDGQPIEYVLVFGLGELNLEPGRFTPPGPVGAAQLVQALTPTVRGRTQAVEVDPDGADLRMYLWRDAVLGALTGEGESTPLDPETDPLTAPRIEVRFGEATDLLIKLIRLETVLPVALTRDVSIIDVATATVSVR